MSKKVLDRIMNNEDESIFIEAPKKEIDTELRREFAVRQSEILFEKYNKLMLGVEEVAEVLGIGTSKAYEMFKSCELPVTVIGKQKIITIINLVEWLINK